MKKLLSILMVALCVLTLGVAAEDPDTKGANVQYRVNESYTWAVHADIDFGANAGVNQTVNRNAAIEGGDAVGVAVTENVISDGKKLQIKVASQNNWRVVNGSTSLAYTATPAGGSALANNDTVLEVPAGTNTGSKAIAFSLNTGSATAEVAGNYLDVLTYTAAIVD